ARARRRAPPARPLALRRLHGAEADPLREGAAEDRHGQDPAVPAARRDAVKVRGVDLHVEDTGGTGPAIAFSHGLLSSTSMWRFQVEIGRASCRERSEMCGA